MEHGISDDILQLEGFREIGRLSHRIWLSVWWHAEAKLQVIQMPLGSKTLLKGHNST